jgi:hypothetical protein
MANFNMNSTTAGLGTIVTTQVPTTDIYEVSGKLTIPTITQGSASQSHVVVVVNVNGSPIYTGLAGAEGFKTTAQCTAADIITVVLSSDSNVDKDLNVVKTTVSISEGV